MSLFNRIKIRTPESVELEFILAGIGNRTIALLIDYLIWGALLVIVLFIWGFLSTSLIAYFPQERDARLWLTAITALLAFLLYTSYFVVLETLWQGQTPGKRYAKIRVIRDDGQPTGLSQALLRSLFRPVDDIFFLGMLMIILGKQEKRLGDLVAGTLVVQEERPVTAAEFPVAPQAQALAKELLTRGTLGAMLPDDFAVVREYLQRRAVMEAIARMDLARRLAHQVATVIALPEVPNQVEPEFFLEAVYLAYQQQSQSEF
jgi:uncharacterized RDD family membrane protein YckC